MQIFKMPLIYRKEDDNLKQHIQVLDMQMKGKKLMTVTCRIKRLNCKGVYPVARLNIHLSNRLGKSQNQNNDQQHFDQDGQTQSHEQRQALIIICSIHIIKIDRRPNINMFGMLRKYYI